MNEGEKEIERLERAGIRYWHKNIILELQCGGDPMIFGNVIGERGLLKGTGYADASEILDSDQIDLFIKGFAHGVAMADLGLSAYDALANDSARALLTKSEELLYQYLIGVHKYRSFRQNLSHQDD